MSDTVIDSEVWSPPRPWANRRRMAVRGVMVALLISAWLPAPAPASAPIGAASPPKRAFAAPLGLPAPFGSPAPFGPPAPPARLIAGGGPVALISTSAVDATDAKLGVTDGSPPPTAAVSDDADADAKARPVSATPTPPEPAPPTPATTPATTAATGSGSTQPSPPPTTTPSAPPAPAAPPTTWVAAFPGVHWSCTDSPINVVVDPTGASPVEVSSYLTAIEAASADTGRPISVSQQAFTTSLGPAPGTIYVSWHPIDGVNAVSAEHPAWTRLDMADPGPSDGTAKVIYAAETVFSHGLPEVAYFHETAREFNLGDSPYPTDDSYGGDFTGLPVEQPFSPGDIAGLRAGAPPCG